MANNYYDMTGVLVLKQVTPVIKALFGPFDLDETVGGAGCAYIADMAESTSHSWESVLENLRSLVAALGLTLPADAETAESDEDDEDDVKAHLQVLATHFGADSNEELANLLEHNDFEDDADLDDLFTIAKAFDDGHGLTGYKTEGCWHSSQPRLFEFGGGGSFTGMHVTVSGSSDQAVQLGEDMENALAVGDSAKAGDILSRQVGSILAGVYDENSRAAVRASLSSLLAIPAPV